MSLARSFRQTRPVHYLVAALIGVSSGYYLFEGPLRRHFLEQARTGGGSSGSGSPAIPSSPVPPSPQQ